MRTRELWRVWVLTIAVWMGLTYAVDANPLETWHLRYSLAPSSSAFKGVCFGGDLFVAVGNNGIFTSSDGITWTKQSSGAGSSLSRVSYGNGLFVAVGRSGTIVTSKDGETWVTQASGTYVKLNGVTSGQGMFVAVGDTGVYGEGGTILASSDGVNWTRQSSQTFQSLSSVIYGKDTFVAVGNAGTVLTSQDGMTWTVVGKGGTSNSLLSVAFGNDMFIAVGPGGTVLTSEDGLTWALKPLDASYDLSDIAFGVFTFVAVSANPPIIIDSPDGEAWTTRSSTLGGFGVTYGKDTFVVVGPSFEIYQSDPITSSPFVYAVPNPLNFRNVTVESRSDKSVTVRNYGSADLILGTITAPPPPFQTMDDRCSGQRLAPGETCTLTYRFSPTEEADVAETVSIASNDSEHPLVLNLLGRGVSFTTRHIQVTPLHLDFGDVNKDRSSQGNVTVTNDGVENLLITDLNLTSSDGFALDPVNLPFSIPPADSHTLRIYFRPKEFRSYNSNLVITSNDPDEPEVMVPLSGRGVGVEITVVPSSVDFGQIQIGSYSEQILTVRSDGTMDLNIDYISNPRPPFTRVGGTCPQMTNLAPNDSCTIIVRFSPTFPGSFSSYFTIWSDDPDERDLDVTTSGIGVTPDISITPEEADFGYVLLGSNPEKIITVQNNGSTNLAIGSVTEPSPPFFKLADTCSGQSIVPNSSCSITLGFTPTSQGFFESALSIFSNDLDENPTTISLIGKGVLFWLDPPEGAAGTRIGINGVGFGKKRGRVLVGGADATIREWTDDWILCSVKKPMPAGSYDVTVKPPKALAVTETETFTFIPPEIISVEPTNPSAMDIAAGTGATVWGNFFGAKPGKILMRRSDGTQARCDVIKWTMDPESGASRVRFRVPYLYSDYFDLVVANKVGEATLPIQIIPARANVSVTYSHHGGGWITVESRSVSDDTLDLEGLAFISPDDYHFPCGDSIEDCTGVKVRWWNETTGQSEKAYQGISGYFIPLHEWEANIPLRPEYNLITVTATDKHGRSGKAIITVTPKH